MSFYGSQSLVAAKHVGTRLRTTERFLERKKELTINYLADRKKEATTSSRSLQCRPPILEREGVVEVRHACSCLLSVPERAEDIGCPGRVRVLRVVCAEVEGLAFTRRHEVLARDSPCQAVVLPCLSPQLGLHDTSLVNEVSSIPWVVK